MVLSMQCDAFVVTVLSDQGRTKGEGWLPANSLKLPTPRNFIAVRPRVALMYWFFGDFRYGVSLLIVILVLYKYRNM